MTKLRPLLAEYATTHLGRPIAVGDPEVKDFEEALLREVFRQGGRVNPKDYYLDVIMLGIPALDEHNQVVTDPETGAVRYAKTAQLKSPNDLMRLKSRQDYRSYRNDLYRMLDHSIPYKLRPKKPLEAAQVKLELYTNRSEKHQLDVEAKYSALSPLLAGLYSPTQKFSAIKPILDSMQADTVFSTTGKETTRKGIGILRDDTDGEFFREGVIRQLEVMQRRSRVAKIRLTVEERSGP